MHDIALYACDFDERGRAEQIQITNASGGAILDTRTISNFQAGEYLQWQVSGNVIITITRQAGPNGIINGLFFDPVPAGPRVTSESPASEATNVAVSSAVTAAFNEAVQSSSIGFKLTSSAGATVSGSVSYNSTTNLATFTPSTALATGTTYTATVSGATDAAGNAMSGLVTWSFTTAPSAVFLKQDTTTEGNWIGTYGTQGYDVINSGSSFPSNVSVTATGESTYTWANPSTSTPALEVPPSGSTRIAACWYSGTSFTVDVNSASGSYDLELYVLDYDSRGRSEQIQISNAVTGAVLSTQSVSNFIGGAYLNWMVSGNVLITIKNLTDANAVLSGLFFDPTPAASTSTSPSTGGGATIASVSSAITATTTSAISRREATAGVTSESGRVPYNDLTATDFALSTLVAETSTGALPDTLFDLLAHDLSQSKSRRRS